MANFGVDDAAASSVLRRLVQNVVDRDGVYCLIADYGGVPTLVKQLQNIFLEESPSSSSSSGALDNSIHAAAGGGNLDSKLNVEDLEIEKIGFAAKLVQILMTYSDEFGRAFVEENSKNIMIKMHEYLSSDNEFVREHVVTLLASFFTRIGGFGPKLTKNRYVTLAKGIAKCLRTRGNRRCQGSAAILIALLVVQYQDFSPALMKEIPDLGRELCEMMNEEDEACERDAAMAIGSLVLKVEGFGKQLMQNFVANNNTGYSSNSNLWQSWNNNNIHNGENLANNNNNNNNFSCSSGSSDGSSEPWGGDSSVLTAGSTISAIGNSSHFVGHRLVQRLCKCLHSVDYVTKGNAARAIAILMSKVDGFGCMLLEADIQAIRALKECLVCEVDDVRGNAALALANLFLTTTGCPSSSVESDSRFCENLCNLLESQTESAVNNAAWAIACLSFVIDGFGRFVVETCPKIGDNLVKCLSSRDVVTKANSAMALAYISLSTEGFGKSMFESDPNLPKYLIELAFHYKMHKGICAIASLTFATAEFSTKLMTLIDPGVVMKVLKSDLKSSNETVMLSAALCSGSLIWSGHIKEMKESLVNANIARRIIECLSNPDDRIKLKATITIAKLFSRVSGFGSLLLKTDRMLSDKLYALRHHREKYLARWAIFSVDMLAALELHKVMERLKEAEQQIRTQKQQSEAALALEIDKRREMEAQLVQQQPIFEYPDDKILEPMTPSLFLKQGSLAWSSFFADNNDMNNDSDINNNNANEFGDSTSVSFKRPRLADI